METNFVTLHFSDSVLPAHIVIFHDFSVSQILREIKFAIFAILEALYLPYYEFLHFLKSEIIQNNKIQSL